MCDECGWETVLEEIQEALDQIPDLPERAEDFGAGVAETLESIMATVSEKSHVTPKQEAAVSNMAAGIGRWLN
jgi:hypothetical protein